MAKTGNMSQLAQMFVISYSIMKDLLPLKFTSKNVYSSSIIIKLTTIILATIYLLIQFIMLLPFILFRLCLKVALKIKYGDSFGGFLSGLDSLFETNTNKTVVNVIQIISTKDEPLIAINRLKKRLLNIHNCSFKFSSNIQTMLGYCFFLKNQVKSEDVLNIVRCNQDEYMTRDMLLDYLHKNCLTMKKNQMWNVTFFEQPLLWTDGNNKNSGRKQFAILCTMRHSLCDGPALVSIYQKYMVQNIPLDLDEKVDVKRRRRSVNLDNVNVRRNPLTSKVDGFSLKIDGNEDWHIATFFEQEYRYVPIIKRIRKKIGVRFTEVLSAAVAASVNDYVKQRNAKLDNFTVGTPIRLKVEDLIKVQKGIYTFDDITNNFSLVAVTLPYNLEERNMGNIIDYIHQYNESLRYSVDPIIAFSFLRDICSYLPLKLIKYCCNSFMSNMTIGVTNLRGFDKCTFNGDPVDDIFFFVPGFLDTAFIFNIFSYDGRLQITLTSREGFVHNREELQEILDNALKYIEKAEQEILKNPVS